MKLFRIQVMVNRFLLLVKRDFHRFYDVVYWPLQDVVLFGFTGLWMQKTQAHGSQIAFILLSGLVLWTFSIQICKDIPLTLLEELWAFNFTNIFASPLLLSEWILSVMILGLLKGIFVFVLMSVAVYVVYGYALLSFGIFLIPALLLLIINGWILGLLATSIIIYYGRKYQVVTWSIGWFFAPLVGAFYAIDILPHWVQTISYCLPPTYIFQTMRLYIATNTLDLNALMWAGVLSIFYFIGVICLVYYAFNKSKIYGLTRLEQRYS